jgi:hypothetical protein
MVQGSILSEQDDTGNYWDEGEWKVNPERYHPERIWMEIDKGRNGEVTWDSNAKLGIAMRIPREAIVAMELHGTKLEMVDGKEGNIRIEAYQCKGGGLPLDHMTVKCGKDMKEEEVYGLLWWMWLNFVKCKRRRVKKGVVVAGEE